MEPFNQFFTALLSPPIVLNSNFTFNGTEAKQSAKMITQQYVVMSNNITAMKIRIKHMNTRQEYVFGLFLVNSTVKNQNITH